MLTVLRYTLADILNENISDPGAVSTTGQCFSLFLISYGIKAEWAFHMRSFPTSNECDFKCVLANLRGNEAGVYTANKPSTSKMLPYMSFHSRARPHPHLLPRHRCVAALPLPVCWGYICTVQASHVGRSVETLSFPKDCGGEDVLTSSVPGKFRWIVTGVGNLCTVVVGYKAFVGVNEDIQTVHFCCEIMDKRVYDSSL